jgi:predicted Kef-type K+ transport protein
MDFADHLGPVDDNHTLLFVLLAVEAGAMTPALGAELMGMAPEEMQLCRELALRTALDLRDDFTAGRN